MKNLLLLALCVCLTIPAIAQKVQWASKVVEYSSQRSAQAHSAEQVLGRPNGYPNGGESEVSWCPQKADNKKEEFIKVRFNKSEQIHQVVIAENFNAGSISKVYIFTASNQGKLVYENNAPKPIGKGTRLLNIILPSLTKTKINQIRVVMNTKAVTGFNYIDAIGVSTSKTPVSLKVNQENDLVFEKKAENLGQNINSSAHDFMPQISPDGRTLYFTRRDHDENTGENKYDDIWFSKWKVDDWTVAKKMPPPVNNEYPNFMYNITPDDHTIVLGNSYSVEGSQLGVSISNRTKGGWTNPETATIEDLHSNSSHNEFFLAANRKILLMTLDRPEGQGKTDIYVAFLNTDKTWSKPKHIGKMVNTASEEMSPFLAADNKTLYFASKGHQGYGDFDVFVTTRLDDSWRKWSVPKNLGNIINTKESESYYSIPASGEFAYYVSKNNSLGKSDIFRIKLPASIKPMPVALIYGNVYNALTNEPMTSDILYEILPHGLEAGLAISDDETGGYGIALPIGEEYGFFATKKGFIAVSDNINLKNIKEEYVEIKRDLYLVPLKAGQKIVMNSVLFYQSEARIIPSSIPELKRLANTLKDVPNMHIKLHGHTDNRGSYEANLKLSKLRVETVKKYLGDYGIHASRIIIEGHGGKEPLVPNDSEEQRRRNRRVEVEIVSF